MIFLGPRLCSTQLSMTFIMLLNIKKNLEYPMLHAKFQDNRTFGSGEIFKGLTIYEHCGHLDHVTWPIL